MLSWFRPTCPVDSEAKHWIEERLAWLKDEFLEGAFTGSPIILPTPDYFPDPYDGSKRSVRRLLERICDYMCVSSSLVELRLMSGGDKVFLVNEHGQWLPGAGGLYEEGESRFVIRIDRSELTNLSGLVGTIAHELAHVRLMGEGRMCGDEFDNELLTDLTVIWFGLGIFQANSPRNWDSSYTNWPGTDLKKPEYMTPPMFGWALAHLAWHRDEMKPGWARYLSSGAKANLKQGLQYLHKTNDSEFRP